MFKIWVSVYSEANINILEMSKADSEAKVLEISIIWEKELEWRMVGTVEIKDRASETESVKISLWDSDYFGNF